MTWNMESVSPTKALAGKGDRLLFQVLYSDDSASGGEDSTAEKPVGAEPVTPRRDALEPPTSLRACVMPARRFSFVAVLRY
jgi:hypothetical protein